MKIAVISDIHGNMQALESVLENIKNQDCEKIYCLGDLAMAGAQPSEVVARFQELVKSDDFELIQGNTDSYLAERSVEVGQMIQKNNLYMGNAYLADIEELSEDQFEFLKNLPEKKEITIGNLKILLVHGSPRSNVENIFPSLTIDKVEEMLSGVDADLVFCGHTHVPCGYQTNTKQTVVNVGSVGRPLSELPKACYALLEIVDAEAKEYNIEHCLVDYDKEKSAELMSARGFDGADKIAAMLISAANRYPS